MFRIAICDNSPKDLQRNLDVVEKWTREVHGKDIMIDVFQNVGDLLCSHNLEKYALMILDILMPKESGIDFARAIRRKGDDTMVIFVSATTEYAMEAFGIQALGYVNKPVKYHEIKNLLDRARVIYDARPQKTMNILSNEGPVKIDLMDLVCVENSNRKIRYSLRDGRCVEVSRRIGIFEEMIEPIPSEKNFVQTHKSYFVNLRYIKQVQDHQVLMDNGMEIPVAKRRLKELQNRYIAYTFEGSDHS